MHHSAYVVRKKNLTVIQFFKPGWSQSHHLFTAATIQRLQIENKIVATWQQNNVISIMGEKNKKQFIFKFENGK